jgi:hypothetical protein
VLTSELKSAQVINKILSEELKQIIDEHKNTENLHTGEKLIYQTKNNAGSETSNRYYKSLKEPRGRKIVQANRQTQTMSQQLNKSNLQSFTDNKDRPIPTVVNGVIWGNNNNKKKTDQKYRQKSKRHRVLLLGDSQIRGCADILKQNLNSLISVE